MQKLLNWFDSNILKFAVTFLLVFIPLYPKLPLLDVLHTWVYIRIEDFLIAIVALIFGIQLLRRKATFFTPLTVPIIIYWIVGGLSLFYSFAVIAPTLANFFPNVAILSYLRRIEYMVLFFIAFSSIRSVKDLRPYIISLAIATLAVVFYGFGQKFAEILGSFPITQNIINGYYDFIAWVTGGMVKLRCPFPAFLTMNEEFAKGMPLCLPTTARIVSTFAGHYDLAAYLVLMISIFGSLVFGSKRMFTRIFFFLVAFFSLLLLLLTASRISFAVYLFTITFMLILSKKKLLIIPVIIVSIILSNYVSGVSARFLKTLRVEDVIYNAATGEPISTVQQLSPELLAKLNQKNTVIAEGPPIPGEELPLGSSFITLPPGSGSVATSVAVIKRPIVSKDLKYATEAAEFTKITGSFLIQKALVYDISFTTRFQGEWPRAIEAFKRNFLLGSGFASISLATDNDYLRALGETGILGLLSFLSIFMFLGILSYRLLPKLSVSPAKSFVIGVLAATAGIALNAILIDVFEASKVAFTLWLLIGLATSILVKQNLTIDYLRDLKKVLTSHIMLWLYAFVSLFILLGQSFSNYFVGDDFTWLRWAATSNFNDLANYFADAQGFFYRPLGKVAMFFMYLVFSLAPQGYHFVNLLMHLLCGLAVYMLVYLLFRKKVSAAIAMVLFLFLPAHAEEILWISSTSSLLASTFALWALVAAILRRIKDKWYYSVFSYVLFTLALFSHENAMSFPLLLLLTDMIFFWIKYPRRRLFASYLPCVWIFIVYVLYRSGAHALLPSGDYSVNVTKLPLNLVGNLFGYLGVFLIGERFVPIYDGLRQIFRLQGEALLRFFYFALPIAVLIAYKFKKAIVPATLRFFYSTIGYGSLFILISLIPYIGLGNIAERNSYLASVGFVLVLTTVFGTLANILIRNYRMVGMGIACGIFVFITTLYIWQLRMASESWYRAGIITKNTLGYIGGTYKDLGTNAVLLFVDLPIREGRAWIFPVGLKDGLWLIYRNDKFTVETDTDIEKALDRAETVPFTRGHVFYFENGVLKEAIRQ